ncbi:hypothetical protein Q7C36_004448 [Tachysurus vachellii]|uniref:Uncharacterized protein n=1 Tax=Tachysurus vachellii TaxID=175792 RepID=A0AA88T416_TACVA|nr:hypothetical protein Q7C36_004448 [Tachysurus vachellii]
MSGLVEQTEEIRDQVDVVGLTEEGGPGEEDCDEELIEAEDSFVMGEQHHFINRYEVNKEVAEVKVKDSLLSSQEDTVIFTFISEFIYRIFTESESIITAVNSDSLKRGK